MAKKNNRKKQNDSKMERKIIIILICLLLISIGYAALATRLNINGTAKISKNSWNVYINQVTNEVTTGGAVVNTHPTIVAGSTSTTNLTYDVDLGKPGDTYSFDFTVKNGGSIDVTLSQLPILSGLSAAQDVYVNHIITDTSNNPVTVEDSVILAGQTKTYRIKVVYDTNIQNGDLPTNDQNISLSAELNYVQK